MSVNEVRETDRPTITKRLGCVLHGQLTGVGDPNSPTSRWRPTRRVVLAAVGSHGQGASLAAARRVAERGHEGPLDAQRGAMW
jgi:hypothetical protein